MSHDLDIEHLRKWVGKTDSARDVVTPHMVRGFRATLDEDPGQPKLGEPAPLAIHWCLAPATVPMSGLGPDGHPARGGFIPPVPLPRRMWAGGELTLHDRLRVGDEVERVSRIDAVDVKEGRTGVLCFVTVTHELSTARGLAISERQDIVYRAAESAKPQPASSSGVADRAGSQASEASREVPATAALLFRYSALTFNGHRIHYDRRYCQEEEGYPGLVVHGPLQATLMLTHAAAMREGKQPAKFSFRGVRPLFDDQIFTVNGKSGAGNSLDLWIADASGSTTMTGAANW